MAKPTKESDDFRPATYFVGAWDNRRKVSSIAGSIRREVAKTLHDDQGELVPDDEIFDELMEEEARDNWGAFHPLAMGGEYLPPQMQGEVEIARVDFASTTGDVLSLRARVSEGELHYRLVDEYWDLVPPGLQKFSISPSSSAVPLSLGELLDLLDTADETELCEDGDVGDTYSALYHWAEQAESPWDVFLSASSEFYPGLSERFAELMCRRSREWQGEDEDEAE